MSFNDNTLTAFDFFAGGGGASLGLHRAGINMLAALNHSPVAIATHAANFPGAKHMLCDIRVQKSWGLGTADIMWASPDCTHHSIAKGGQSRDAKERALAEELPRFAYNLNVNCIMVENVKEFLDWGPLELKVDKHGQPILDKKGEEQWVAIKARKKEYYNAWVASLAELGFVNYEYRLLNAADFGVPQSRLRYFGIFTRKGVAINWPQPTHDRHGKNGLPKWEAVRTVLDLSDRGRSIFTEWDKGPGRKAGDVPAEKSLARIQAGLLKHVIGKGEARFLDKRTSNHPSGKPSSGASTEAPGPTLATCYLPDLVTPSFLLNPAWFGGSHSVEQPGPVAVASQDKVPLSVVSAEFMVKGYSGDPTHMNSSVDEALGTATCADHHHFGTAYMMHNYGGVQRSRAMCNPSTALTQSGGQQYAVTPVFLTQYNSGSDNNRVLSLDGVSNVVPVENRFGLVQLGFAMQSNGVSQGVSPGAKTWALTSAGRGITAKPNQSLVQLLVQANGVRKNDTASRLSFPLSYQAPTMNTNGGNLNLLSCLMSYYGNGDVRPTCNPCGALCTRDTYALLGFVTGSGYGQRPYSWGRPSSPLVASRRHPYLVLSQPGSPVADLPSDSPAMRELKALCREHGIADIYMRMLKVSELKAIMGFPAEYHLGGSATKQKEMLGNAVVPQVSEAIARAMLPSLQKARLRKLPRLRRDAISRWEQGALFGKEVPV